MNKLLVFLSDCPSDQVSSVPDPRWSLEANCSRRDVTCASLPLRVAKPDPTDGGKEGGKGT